VREQSLCWALYRAGDWKKCVAAVGRLIGNSEDDFIPAMAHEQLGNRTEARACFDRADAWLSGYETRSAERMGKGTTSHPLPSMLRRMRAEAADLLGLVAPPPRPVEAASGTR